MTTKRIACAIGLNAIAVWSLVVAPPALGWFDQGHEIVAIVAAGHLSAAPRGRVAQILGVPAAPEAVAKAMAAAAIRPDNEFRSDQATRQWHYIDICRQSGGPNEAAQCPTGACVTAKIDEYARRLRAGDYDRWGAAGDLAFLIHLAGDIHQPLHAASNADRGGTCQKVESSPPAANLHILWDETMVAQLESGLSAHDAAGAANALEKLYPDEGADFRWREGSAQAIARESHSLAESEVYRALGIPVHSCANACDPATAAPVEVTPAYLEREAAVVGRRLVLAGRRLANLLNSVFSAERTARPLPFTRLTNTFGEEL